MHRITNLTNSPQDIHLRKGKGRLAARGTDVFDIDPSALPWYRACGYLRVEEAEGEAENPAPAAQDSVPEDINALRSDYLDITGEEPDKRWGARRLRAEIDKALA